MQPGRPQQPPSNRGRYTRRFPGCPLALAAKQRSKLHDHLPSFPFLAPWALGICFIFPLILQNEKQEKGGAFCHSNFSCFQAALFFQTVLKLNKIDKTRLMSWGLEVFILFSESVTSKPLMASTNLIIIGQSSLAKAISIDWALAKMRLIWEPIVTVFVKLQWCTAGYLADLGNSGLSLFSFSLLLSDFTWYLFWFWHLFNPSWFSRYQTVSLHLEEILQQFFVSCKIPVNSSAQF